MSVSGNDIASQRPARSNPASTARYARKQQAIIAAASEILNRDGVKGMTLASVAERVGLITTSVTYYFKRKEDLAVACFLDAIARIEEIVNQALEAPDPPARLLRLLTLWLELRRLINLGEAPPVAFFSDIRALDKPHRTVVADAFRRVFEKVRAIFISPDYSWLDDKQRSARAHIIIEQILWAVSWLRRFDVEDYDRIRDRMQDIFVHGLAGKGSAWDATALPLESVLQGALQEPSARETFLIAATRLINERGYRGASVEKISERLNVTKGSFYHHNEAKDDLVVDCFKRSFETMRRIQRAVMNHPRAAGNSWRQLTMIASTLMDYQMSAHGPLLRTSALVALPEPMRNAMIDAYSIVSNRFAGIMSDGIAAGSVHAVDPVIAAQMLAATLNASAEYRWWVADAVAEETIELYAKPLLMGLFSR